MANDPAAKTDGPAGAGPASPAAAPQLGLQSQYIKDLSFENPNAPASLQSAGDRPEIKVSIQVNLKEITGIGYEVVLHITAEGTAAGTSLFVLDLTYAGIFTLTNVPREAVEAILLIEAPRFLFPFARRIVADATRDGGFPPLLLNPVDFQALYRQQRRAAAPVAQPVQPN
jgi:preprotein translocase subunit SecB